MTIVGYGIRFYTVNNNKKEITSLHVCSLLGRLVCRSGLSRITSQLSIGPSVSLPLSLGAILSRNYWQAVVANFIIIYNQN